MIDKNMGTALFFTLTIIACLLLLIAGIAAAVAAADAFGSSNYNTEANIRSAHTNLTGAAALGISSFIILIVVMMVAGFSGGFSVDEVTNELLNKESLTSADLTNIIKGEYELKSGHTTQIMILVILSVISVIAFIVGLLSIFAAVELGSVTNQDAKSNSAYTNAIVASVAGVGGIGLMVISVITYVSIRNARAKQLQDLEAKKTKIATQ